jgi:hypothetical protein
MNGGTETTVGDALNAFRAANGIPADEGASWTCRIGPALLRLPNFAWRRKAVLAHDIHHVLTQTPCTMLGECRMAAWEFGAGGMPHWGATLFCLPLAVAGAIVNPRQTWIAYRDGRRSRNLHGTSALEHILSMPLDQGRRAIRRVAPH